MEAFVVSAVAEALGTHVTFTVGPLDEVRSLRELMLPASNEVRIAS